MTQPEPITQFAINLMRVQVPTDADHPHGEGVILEIILPDQSKAWFMMNPDEAVNVGRGLIAEGELARTGLIMPDTWNA